MPKLNRDGVQIYYEVHGEGPVILLSHGYSSTSAMWKGQIEALSAKHKLVIWDMRGHGDSDYPTTRPPIAKRPPSPTWPPCWTRSARTRPSSAACRWAATCRWPSTACHPERVRALLIIDTGPGYRNDEAREGWNQNAIKRAERLEREGLPNLANASAEVRLVRHRSADGLAKAARGMLTQRDAGVMNSLSSVAVPSLVVVGADDTPSSPPATTWPPRSPARKRW